MSTLNIIVAGVILIWAAIYAGSFALWTWKRKNKLGSASIFLMIAAMFILTIYAAFIKG